jgi:hypothetical protein
MRGAMDLRSMSPLAIKAREALIVEMRLIEM